jgi:hypothetical protein
VTRVRFTSRHASNLHTNNIVEFTGTLTGFDDYVNMVLEDVTEYDYSGNTNKMNKILLNGNNICMVRISTSTNYKPMANPSIVDSRRRGTVRRRTMIGARCKFK